MKILVTAFGPFDGRPENASSLALSGLTGIFPQLWTRVLPVDSVIAPARLRQAVKQIRPDVLIMLGEAAGSKTIRLETTAFNELDFSIPDIAGRQPRGGPVVSNAPSHLLSTLPLDTIHSRLTELGHGVCFSNDAGRYLCNQLFFVARHFLDTRAISCRAGFIHLPLAREYPTDRAVAALAGVIGAF